MFLRNNVKSAFTLLELLISISLVTMTLALLYTSYIDQIRTANLINKRCSVFIEGNTIMKILTEELENIDPIPVNNKVFSGNSGELVYRSRKKTFKLSENKMSFLNYKYNSSKFSLTRKNIDDTGILSSVDLGSMIKSVKFNFFDGNKWVEKWETTNKLPFAVMIFLEFTMFDKKLRSIVYLPDFTRLRNEKI
ncbi:prepilin-type N-terminal cleavage/methylation domain-containing protein [bacterium]|nr:prepilin-type N-terminal cleavage/methylation domain-containing protein [bacterium]